jgi:alpha-tubulin suppressor-like RCC1 family protein
MKHLPFSLLALSGAMACGQPTQPAAAHAVLASTPATLAFSHVTAGGTHSCGVTLHSSGDVAYCWGANEYGQLGIGITRGPEHCGGPACSTKPVAVARGLAFRLVSAGGVHTCGITTDDVAYCWGRNESGELGTGSTGGFSCFGLCIARPVRVAGGLAFRQLSAGESHTCGVTTDDVAYCWGNNNSGELGDGSLTSRARPVRVAGGLRFRHVNAEGQSHTCGVTTNDMAYCWGASYLGQLGNGTSTGPEPCLNSVLACSTKPVRVVGGRAFVRVNGGLSYTCGFTTQNVAFCWGLNVFGELGNGTTIGPETCDGSPCSTKPVRVVGGLRFSRINAGGGQACGVTTNQLGYCWGDNTYGQLGNGSYTGPEDCAGAACSTRPVRVVGGLPFQGIQAGERHSCGLTPNKVGYCWGSNASGQLGSGTSTGPETCSSFGDPCSTRPVAIAPPASPTPSEEFISAQ